MNASRPVRRSGALLVVMVAMLVAGCSGSGAGQRGSAFVFLTVDQFSLSGATPVALVISFLEDDGASTLVCVTLRNTLKNPTLTAPTALDNVVVQSYTVTFSGLGLGPFRFNATVLVPAGTISGTPPAPSGNTARFPIILVPAEAKRQPPLRPFPQLPLTTTATILFKGRDGRGAGVDAEGSLTVVLRGDGTDTAASCG
ncbi:MAG: hypothetical protein HY002_22285 [Candidatus Rokubacteria bacterium]|nr:hypothetical protein [Candidatus Rokubacteria bacterium]